MSDQTQPLLKVDHVRQFAESHNLLWVVAIVGHHDSTQSLSWGKTAHAKVYSAQLSDHIQDRWLGEVPREIHEDFRLEAAQNKADLEHLRAEVDNVLLIMDQLAATWGDEGVFRRCRDRLRAARKGGGNDQPGT